MIAPLRIVACSLKSVKGLPRFQKLLPVGEYTGKSRFTDVVDTGES
jgi:hypothetical protein